MIAFIKALSEPWLILPEMLQTILEIAARENPPVDIQALRREMGRPVDGTQETYSRDGIAIVPVVGPIFPRADFFSAVSGVTTTERLARDIHRLAQDPEIRGIILEMDSPGGALAGINELAGQIRETAAIKPIKAYVGARAASAAFWLASATDEIIVDQTADLGSIGVVIAVQKPDAPPSAKNVEFVSSVSPFKRANPSTESGARVYQQHADRLGEIFVSEILKFRPQMKREDLLELGGRMAIGEEAVRLQLADRLGSLESLIAEMSADSTAHRGGTFAMKLSETKIGKQLAGLLGMEVDASAAEAPPAPPAPAATPPPSDDSSAKAELEEARKALAAERDERIKAQADAWIHSLAAASLGTPAVRDAYREQYLQAARDDLAAPVAQGQQSRVDRLKALAQTTLKSSEMLTSEQVPGKEGVSLPADPSGQSDDYSKDGTVLYARQFAEKQVERQKQQKAS